MACSLLCHVSGLREGPRVSYEEAGAGPRDLEPRFLATSLLHPPARMSGMRRFRIALVQTGSSSRLLRAGPRAIQPFWCLRLKEFHCGLEPASIEHTPTAKLLQHTGLVFRSFHVMSVWGRVLLPQGSYEPHRPHGSAMGAPHWTNLNN